MANFPKKSSIKAKISLSQALWGFLILGVLSLNFASLNKNFLVSTFINQAFSQKNLGGPNIDLQDSLLAIANANDFDEIMADIRENENFTNSDALTQILITNALPIKKNPDKSDKLSAPTIGWNWGRIHAYNAVDIANRCGTPIYAADEGFIIEEAVNDNWNGGYGNYIKIEHPNNIQTLYAHLATGVVSLGQYIKNKELIGQMGNTGNTHGPTGCHLHYEVYGAKNPLAK